MKVDILVKIIERERNSRINRSNPASLFIYNAYNNVIAKIREKFSDIENITSSKIMKMEITDGMKEKLKKMIKMKAPIKKDSLLEELVKYMGLGKAKAQNLIDDGLKNIDQLQKTPWLDKLPIETQMMLKNKPIRKIPHEHIKKLEPIFTKHRVYKAVLVGSYRRQTSFSRDIDIMLVSDKKDTINKYIDYLKKKLTKIVVYSSGPNKVSFLFKHPETKGKFYKADAFITPKKYEAGMLLYSTGSKSFNIRMRAKAKAKGYLLNQNGLYNRETGRYFPIKTEKGFFKKLSIDYVEPEKR